MNRIVFTATADGSVMIVREARVGVAGSAKDRRKQVREGVTETWRVLGRVISRSLNDGRVPFAAAAWFTTNINIVPTAGVTVEMPSLPGPAVVTPYEFTPYVPPVTVVEVAHEAL